MSFFYDLNKKLDSIRATPEVNTQQLNEQASPLTQILNERSTGDYSAVKAAAGKDIGKPGKNFGKIAADAAKRYGSEEAGKRVAGAVLNKLRHPKEGMGFLGEKDVEEAYNPNSVGAENRRGLDASHAANLKKKAAAGDAKAQAALQHLRDKKERMSNDFNARMERESAGMDESALQAAFGKKKYGDQGMKALQKAGRDHASDKTMNKIRNRYDKYDESMDEGDFKPDFLDIDKDGNTTEPMKSAARGVRDVDEAAKYRDPKYKDKLYTQQPPDYTYGPDMDDAYYNPKPDDYAGRKRKIGGSEFDHNDPLERGQGIGRSGIKNNILDRGPRKGLPSRDQISSLKSSIKAAKGTHTEPNLPEDQGGIPMTPKQQKFAKLAKPFDKITFADKIVGAKKEVDEMLGQVAADAMKKAVRGRDQDMEEASTGNAFDYKNFKQPEKQKPTSFVHKGTYGTEYDGDKEDAKAIRTKKQAAAASGQATRGRGRPKNNASADTGEVMKPDFSAFGDKVKLKPFTGKITRNKMVGEDDLDPKDQGEYNQEGDMAKDSIKTVVRHAQALEKILGDDDNLPEWVQSKLAKIESMMTAVDDYMQNQQDDDMDVEMDEESTHTRDSRAERAGRKVAKDIEYDEKKKDGIHGKKRNSEDDTAERAGKKVTKDIEYDEKKDKKKKEVDETTSSGSVSTGGSAAPKSSGGMSYGKGIYDSLNRELEGMISESMNISMNMSNDSHGGPNRSLTVTATDEDATALASILRMAGMGGGNDHMPHMNNGVVQPDDVKVIDFDDGTDDLAAELSNELDEQDMTDGSNEKLSLFQRVFPNEQLIQQAQDSIQQRMMQAGKDSPAIRYLDNAYNILSLMYSNPTEKLASEFYNNIRRARDVEQQGMAEAYGDTDETLNKPDWPTDAEGTDDAMMYSGGIDGPKSTGQTTIPVIASQQDRQHAYEDAAALRRMMEMAGLPVAEAAPPVKLATPQHVDEPVSPASAAATPGKKPVVKPVTKLATPQHVDEPVKPVKEDQMAHSLMRELHNFKY